MKHGVQKVLIVGGGVAGLCAAVYAQSCGYDTEVLEMHESLGGLATSWRRGDYTFETCLNWLVGSNPKGDLHSLWQQVFDIDALTFVSTEIFAYLETEDGKSLRVFTDIDRLEQEFLERAPEDAGEVRHLTSIMRKLVNFEMPDITSDGFDKWLSYLHDVPYLPLLHQLFSVSCKDYGRRFKHPLLRVFFGEDDLAEMSVAALILALVWMHKRNAGYPLGGSQTIVRSIAERLVRLGGRIRCGAKVERIVVDHDDAVGVRLEGGEELRADWVVSAADGRATIFDMLEGKYLDKEIRKTYEKFVPYPSYVQVSLGVALDLSQQPGLLIQLLDTPMEVDPETRLRQLQFRFFHYDPTFAPSGKTAVTCFLPTRNFAYWRRLHKDDPEGYKLEKQRVADSVIAILSKRVPHLAERIEVIDVATPATIYRYTGNWQGSMEGWLMVPGRMYGPLPNTLPGLNHFVMAGQWVLPGGGLPSCLLSARSAVQAMCRHDRVPFATAEAVTG